MKNGMSAMDDIVINLTGCSRQTATFVVNSILDEYRKQNEDCEKKQAEEYFASSEDRR